jgi:hypothetical protein
MKTTQTSDTVTNPTLRSWMRHADASGDGTQVLLVVRQQPMGRFVAEITEPDGEPVTMESDWDVDMAAFGDTPAEAIEALAKHAALDHA